MSKTVCSRKFVNIDKELFLKKLCKNVYSRKKMIEMEEGFFGDISQQEFTIFYKRHFKIDKDWFLGMDATPTLMEGKIIESNEDIIVEYKLEKHILVKIMVIGVIALLGFFGVGVVNSVGKINGWELTMSVLVFIWIGINVVTSSTVKKKEVNRFNDFWSSID